MAEGNGSTPTRAELNAHIKGIDEHFDIIEEDIKSMKFDLHELHTEVQAGFRLIASRQWLGPMAHQFLASGALLCAAVALFVALYLH